MTPATRLADLGSPLSRLDWYQLNVLLYRCDAEEWDSERRGGVYDIPGYGPLPYAGLEGIWSVLREEMRIGPNPAHPLFQNLRQGSWLVEYTWGRLVRTAGMEELGQAMARYLEPAARAAPAERARVFVGLFGPLYELARQEALSRFPGWIQKANGLVQRLALGSVQLCGTVDSASLYPAVPLPSLAAGLPHFGTRHMRCWGRDIFISLPGLFLSTGRLGDAKSHLIAFAACTLNGLIPNLLDSGRRPRFNARDATWWFLWALQHYCRRDPSILEADVPRRFPDGRTYLDYDDPTIYGRTAKMHEIVQEIMERHAEGIAFREWNAGPGLDAAMQDEGFNIRIGMDRATGFIHGGNALNCGTWMDKMGESHLNRGIPATPRDGAAVELVALLKTTLDWLVELGWRGVPGLTYAGWRDRVQREFEGHFYVAETTVGSSGRSGYYRDTVGASDPSCDLQLRPNYLVAMAVVRSLWGSVGCV